MAEDKYERRVTTAAHEFSLRLGNVSDTSPVPHALNQLAKAEVARETNRLSVAHDFRQWLKLQDPCSDDDSQALKDQCKKVAELWTHPNNEFRVVLKGDAIPSIDELIATVNRSATKLSAEKQGTWGKITGRFHSFVKSLNDHSYLFSVVPSNDKYVSLITGVLTSIAKVSTNYTAITKAFASQLDTIQDDLHDVPTLYNLGIPKDMMTRVTKLYICIFEFLHEAMCYYNSKKIRAKRTFNLNYYTEGLKPLTAKIRDAITHVRHGAELAGLQKLDYLVHRTDQNQELRHKGGDVRQSTLDELHAKLDILSQEVRRIGYNSRATLYAVGQQHFYNQDTTRYIDIRSADAGECPSEPDESSRDEEEEVSNGDVHWRSDIRCHFEPLTKFTDDGREELRNILRGTTSPMIPQEVSTRIQSWIQNKTTQLLWVEGPFVPGSGSSLSLTALRIYEVTMQAGIPCVSFFCKQKYGFMTTNSTVSGATLISLLYTMADQLINLLDDCFESSSKFTLDNLDLSTSDEVTLVCAALELIDQLLQQAPKMVTFIIDGLELVSKPAELPHLLRLIEILRKAGGEDRIFKVLLTTNGNSRALGKAMNLKERVDGGRFAQRGPGQLLKGATHVDSLKK